MSIYIWFSDTEAMVSPFSSSHRSHDACSTVLTPVMLPDFVEAGKNNSLLILNGSIFRVCFITQFFPDIVSLGGGFRYFLFSALLGEIIQFD